MKKTFFICIAAMLCLEACGHGKLNEMLFHGGKPSEKLCNDGNAVYYWRTTYYLNEKEEDFLIQHKIKTMYIRFFDVDINKNENFIDKCAPVATILFGDSRETPQYQLLKKLNIVPVIFITTDAIKEYASFTDDIAHRIYAMCLHNELDINEVQFDCDWTMTTRDAYFQFLKDVRQSLKFYFAKEIKISSTIRLHQLAQLPPDVDYGVLMCYNTGDFKNYNTRNSILDVEDVKPYLQYLDTYSLPLRLALPIYSWGVEFDKNKKFVKLNRYVPNNFAYNIYDTTKFKCLDAHVYELKKSNFDGPTQYLRYEQVPAETISEAKKLIKKHAGKMSIILFHLESQDFSKYSDDEIKSFYN